MAKQEILQELGSIFREKLNDNFTELYEFAQEETSVAYVRSVGDNNNAYIARPDKPFLTIEAALDALNGAGGVIDIGIGSFVAPPLEKITDNLHFIGVKKPSFDNITIITDFENVNSTYPNNLINGSIIVGSLIFRNKKNVSVKNLGIDTNGEPEGLMVSNYEDSIYPLDSRLNGGIEISDVLVLMNSPSLLGHAFLLENLNNPIVSNIESWGGYHGFVSKSFGGTFNGIITHSNAGEGINLKSNGLVAEGNFVKDTILSNFKIYNGGFNPLLFDNRDINATGLQNVIVSNGMIMGGHIGITFFDPPGSALYKDIILNNIIIKDVLQYGIKSTRLSNVSFSNINISGCEFGLQATGEGVGVFVNNCSVFNASGIAFAFAGKVSFNHIHAEDIGHAGYGYGIYSEDLTVTGGHHRIINCKDDYLGAFLPAFQNGVALIKLDADPAVDKDQTSVIWQSSGAGTGDDGDIMIKIKAGGVTKITTLIDFSTL